MKKEKKKEVKSFTVKRSKWLRGEGHGNSYLLRPNDGKMCCLGFLGIACGAEKEDIFDNENPHVSQGS